MKQVSHWLLALLLLATAMSTLAASPLSAGGTRLTSPIYFDLGSSSSADAPYIKQGFTGYDIVEPNDTGVSCPLSPTRDTTALNQAPGQFNVLALPVPSGVPLGLQWCQGNTTDADQGYLYLGVWSNGQLATGRQLAVFGGNQQPGPTLYGVAAPITIQPDEIQHGVLWLIWCNTSTASFSNSGIWGVLIQWGGNTVPIMPQNPA